MNLTGTVLQNTPLLNNSRDFGVRDQEILRRLAGEVAEKASRPIEVEKAELWRRHNQLEKTRPLVFCSPEGSWREIFPESSLRCENEIARNWEAELRRELYAVNVLKDDKVINPIFPVSHVHESLDWGLPVPRIGGQDNGAFTWEPPVKTPADIAKIQTPVCRIDFAGTARLTALAGDIFGDLLPVKNQTYWWWSTCRTETLMYWRGLDQMMFDMIDNPDMLHLMMGKIADGWLAFLAALEENHLLAPNWDWHYVGSGGFGWTDELPSDDFEGAVGLRDIWGFSEAQETVGISDEMFAEFIFPYQVKVLEKFGLNCYGCCEPVDGRWKSIQKIPNLRRVSVSPWADIERMAEYLEDNYIFSWKPNPADVAGDEFNEERIRKLIRDVFERTRDCRMEIILKDTHTVRNEPERLAAWVRIAREEAVRL